MRREHGLDLQKVGMNDEIKCPQLESPQHLCSEIDMTTGLLKKSSMVHPDPASGCRPTAFSHDYGFNFDPSPQQMTAGDLAGTRSNVGSHRGNWHLNGLNLGGLSWGGLNLSNLNLGGLNLGGLNLGGLNLGGLGNIKLPAFDKLPLDLGRLGQTLLPTAQAFLANPGLAKSLIANASALVTTNLGRNPGNSAPFNQLVVFGDSLSDTGNLFKALGGLFPPSPPYSQGRFSNGPIWVDKLGADLGLSNATLNFAVGGATSGRSNVGAQLVGGVLPPGVKLPGLLDEIDQFTAAAGGKFVNPNALYVVWAGANDFLTLPPDLPGAIQATLQGVANIASAVTSLAKAGARTILVPNLPDISLAPLVTQSGQQPTAKAFSIGFNVILDVVLTGLERKLGVDLIEANMFGLTQGIAARPGQFGFTNVSDPQIKNLTSPGTFAFWDDFHPTTQVHQLVANTFERALKAPSAKPAAGSTAVGQLLSQYGPELGQLLQGSGLFGGQGLNDLMALGQPLR
jgi:phospholipase/lecithinase/hemolysin